MALELYAKKQREVDEPNLGQVGDVKTSVLTEAQFQVIHGSLWTLMDGKSVTGSLYETVTGNSTIPDARGVFLRSKDNGAGQNPDGELALGAAQGEAFKSHVHDLAISSTTSSLAGGGSVPTSGPATDTAPIVGGANGAGGNETRPKNITVNYFVKID